jgi:lipopolysaccharide/colanic/teichoic acid biosynthesis glycosyltransferase
MSLKTYPDTGETRTGNRYQADPAIDRRERYKRPFDLFVLTAAHVSLFPLWVILWGFIPVFIWLEDRGPIFYKQRRMGKGGRVFTVLKFRTMVVNADKLGPAWTMEHDQRVTRVGRILRKTALDELPQVLSMWKGDLGLVGPRALAADEQQNLEAAIPGFAKRLQSRPGLTGLAQVYNVTDAPESKLRYDLEYLSRMSPWLDLKLLTLSVVNTIFVRWDKRSGKARHLKLLDSQKAKTQDSDKK